MKKMPGNPRIEGPQIWCVIPVYNNKCTVKDVARKCSAVIKNVIVVDDGSTDVDVLSLLSDVDVVLLNHETNRGKGQAILTAARYVGEQGGDYMITIDADGQHNPEDIKNFLPIILEGNLSLIIGCRDFNTENIPGKSRFGRRFANLWLQVETGIQIDDCQSGFRAYPVKQLNQLSFRGRRYDFEAEVLAKAAWAGLELKTVPVGVFYPIPAERVSHFKPFLDNLRLSLIHSMLVGRRLLPFKHRRFVNREKVAFGTLLWHPVRLLKQLLRENATPEGLAISAAVGIFLATLPLLFVHTTVIIYVAVRLHLNKVMAINIQHLCLPPVVPVLCIEIGHYMLHGYWLTDISFETIFSQFSYRLLEWLLGSLILAPIGAVWVGLIVFFTATFIKKRINSNG